MKVVVDSICEVICFHHLSPGCVQLIVKSRDRRHEARSNISLLLKRSIQRLHVGKVGSMTIVLNFQILCSTIPKRS